LHPVRNAKLLGAHSILFKMVGWQHKYFNDL
jgi:hypothetical protein